jgi:hypothetical protein
MNLSAINYGGIFEDPICTALPAEKIAGLAVEIQLSRRTCRAPNGGSQLAVFEHGVLFCSPPRGSTRSSRVGVGSPRCLSDLEAGGCVGFAAFHARGELRGEPSQLNHLPFLPASQPAMRSCFETLDRRNLASLQGGLSASGQDVTAQPAGKHRCSAFPTNASAR